MGCEVLLTPWFLDGPESRLDGLARPGWSRNPETPAGGDQLTRMSAVHGGIRAFVERSASRSGLPVSVAGDCCAAIPVLAGLQHAGLAPVIVWLDAHGDFNTADSTISGFLGGMPLAMMTGRGYLTLLKNVGAHPVLDSDVFLADARDLDPRERELLVASGVNHLRLEEVFESLPPSRPVYVHLDCDVLDSAVAPAMRYPVGNGPSLGALVALGKRLRDSGRLAALSVTTWDFGSDLSGKTEAACLEMIGAFAGEGFRTA